ncbi:MAG: DUF4390 domain-containing protein [Gallionella sp.]|nr:DUF4390 domain-containing protein [Gallionella sp.]MDD4959298.1 DUF4390 domain-containing protein [Gallionella sp.]
MWLLLLLWGSLTYADSISVNKADVRVSEDSYQLAAEFNIRLNSVVEQALSHGVAIYFVSEFSVTRSRWYWLDEEIVKSEHIIKLSYNVLTGQYRISHGALYQNFPTLEDALRVMQRQSSPAIAMDSFKKSGNYLAGARLRLDIDQLPKLLQVNALTSKDWELDSNWYRWVIRPDDIAARQPSEGVR